MRVARYLTEREFSQAEALANELACQRCRADGDFLRGLVREYVGQAEAAGGTVLARCANDPAYLASIVQSYIGLLDEPGLVDFLRSMTETSAVVQRLGFNPFDDRRREAYRLSHRFLNHRSQLIALAIVAGAACLTILFPPWQMVRRQRIDACASAMGQPDQTVEVRFAGYHFISTPPVVSTPPGAVDTPGGSGSTYVIYRLYWEMLLLQLLGLFVVLVIACVTLRDRRSFEERVAALSIPF